MAKIIEYDSEARNKLKKGINQLTEAVKVTLGPRGRNVVIDKKIWCSYDYKRRCYRCKRNRARGSNGKHGCSDGQRSGFQNQ